MAYDGLVGDTASEIRGDDALLVQDAGLQSHRIQIEEDVLAEGTRLSAADQRRNAELERLRGLVPVGNAVLGIDLADVKQHAVLCNQDSQVVRRYRVRAKAWELGPLLDRAVADARAAGFAGVTVACEPTGHRWKIIAQMAADRGLPVVCIQPLAMRRAREQEDYTTGKSDAKDAMLIARLAARLYCYVPEELDEVWGRLRHAGIHRTQVIEAETADRQRIGALLECAWPAVLSVAPTRDFDSPVWLACLWVGLTVGADGEVDPVRVRAELDYPAFAAAVRGELGRFGGHRLRQATAKAVYAVLDDPEGVRGDRAGVLRRARWALEQLAVTKQRLVEAETYMVGVLAELGLTELAGSIPAVSVVSVAAILAETGDLSRFTHARALIKHAGLAPRPRESGEYTGTTRITGRGRPLLRLALWRAVFGALLHNPDMKARYQHLTTRPQNPLTDGQARAALAAALLRQIYHMVTQKTPYQPYQGTAIAA
jgi:transposase